MDAIGSFTENRDRRSTNGPTGSRSASEEEDSELLDEPLLSLLDDPELPDELELLPVELDDSLELDSLELDPELDELVELLEALLLETELELLEGAELELSDELLD